MSCPARQPTPKFRRTRLVLEAPGGVRPLLGFGISSDGGLLVDLSQYAPIERYRYGVIDVPAGEGEMTAYVRADDAAWVYDDVPPKLHYHRSGLVTISATGQHEHKGVKAPPINELDHVHFMTFIARHPHLWRITTRRNSDMLFKPNAPLETLSIACFAGQLDNLREPHRSAPGNPQVFLVEDDLGAVVPTVVARLTAGGIGYYVWLELHPNREFGEGSDPLVLLQAHDHSSAKDLTQPFSMIGLWSVPHESTEASAAKIAAEQTVVRGTPLHPRNMAD